VRRSSRSRTRRSSTRVRSILELASILSWTVKRIVPLLVAFAVTAAPAAFDVCQIVCASASHSAMSHDARAETQQCPEHAQTSGARLTNAQHACDHDGDQPPAPGFDAGRETSLTVPPATLVPTFEMFASCRTAGLVTGAGERHRSVSESRSAVPLRI